MKIPFADFNALKLPPGKELEADFSLLSDIFPTVSEFYSSISNYYVIHSSRAGTESSFP